MQILFWLYIFITIIMLAMVLLVHLFFKRAGGIKLFWPVFLRDILLYVVLWPITSIIIMLIGRLNYLKWENATEISLYKKFKRGLF